MRSFIFTMLFTVSLILLCAQGHEPDYTCHGKHQLVPTRSLSLDEQRMMDDSNARSDTFDIQHYEIHIDITDYFGQTINCHATIEIKPLMDGEEDIRLDLKDLFIDSIYVDGSPSTFTHIGEVLEIALQESTVTNESFFLDVWYQGHPYQDPQWGGFYFENNYIYNLGIGLSTIPPNFGRVWYPCFDTFVERATYDWHVTSANGMVPHCQGELISELQLEGDTISRHYALDIPIPTYLSAIAAANYVSIEYDHQGAYGAIPVKLHAKSGQETAMETRFANLPAAIDALEYWFGPYIWNKVGYVMTTVGAMEHATNIAYPQSMMSQTGASNEGLFTHELGHLWWGDMVSPEIRNHMWLKEGNAEYSQHLMREWLSGEEEFKAEVKDNHLYVLETADYNDGGFYALSPIPDEIIYGRTTYYKGASVVHNLRGYMGDSLFRVGMQAVLDTFYLSYMNPEDFKGVLSGSTGVDLTDFFNDQVYSPGFSTFVLDSMETTEIGGGQYSHHLYLQQKLRACPSHYSNVPLDISFMDSNWIKHKQTISASGQYAEVDLITDFNPLLTILNGENKLNQARMDYESILTETTNTITLPWVEFKLKVEEINEGDSAFFRGEHHWVAPDTYSIGGDIIELTNGHYFTVGGEWPEGMRLTGRFDYVGVFPHHFDYDLVNSGSEESIGLVYRPDASEPWEIYPYTSMTGVGGSNGTAKADSLMKGDYTFARLESTVGIKDAENIAFSIFPNPVRDEFALSSTLKGIYMLEIMDPMGQVIQKNRVMFSEGGNTILSLKNKAVGMYLIRLTSEENGEEVILNVLKE